ncbi:MAG: NAD-glutamate dehydrogenase [Chlamydiales bacterium]
MVEPKLPPEQMKKAIKEELERFEQCYLWLEKSMPRLFFQEIEKEWISLIVHSLMGFEEQDFFSEIHLKNAAISLCIDSPEADVNILKNYPMYGIRNYTTYISRELIPFATIQGKLRIATIYFTEAIELTDPPLTTETRHELNHLLKARHPNWSMGKIDRLIDQIVPRFLRKIPIEGQVFAVEMFERAQIRDHCQYEVQYEENWDRVDSPSMSIVLAWKNVPKHNFLYRLARIVHQHKLVMRRVNAAYIKPYKTQNIFMLSFEIHGAKGEAAWEAADIADFLQELVTLKYFGSLDQYDATFVSKGLLRGNLANFLRAMMHFIHQVLINVDPNLYDLENIEEGLCRHSELTIKLCQAFEDKFHPHKHSLEKFEKSREEFLELVDQLDTGHEFHDKRRKNILLQGMNFVSHTLKTNFYRNNKTAYAFRLDPAYLDYTPFDRTKLFPVLPFAIFFIKGMHFLGFHIRFKDLSRGGLRTIFPEIKERMLAERNTIFIECYHLAYTQQKKNKDIPEGGAKGVIFLKPYERLVSEMAILSREMYLTGMASEEIETRLNTFKNEQKLEYLYQTQRSFIKNFLSLVNCDLNGNLKAKHIVDYWKKPEYIYLGPDENMHNSMIEWIASESQRDGYRPGGAFISGKPKIGINHKEYGVTSLGVNVYMHAMLNYLNIHPEKQEFRVKISGGPDGDVAGNQIKNLYTHYPNTAKLVALTDISGTIHDPNGLDLGVVVELFKKGQPIRFYPYEKLSPGGFLLDRENRREPTEYLQQTLCWRNKEGNIIADWLSGNETNTLLRHNLHQTPADIFIPCGGRPETLHDTNYKEFLDAEGRPTSKAIVEGANLYLSSWACHYLEKMGVLIIKDSSANKGGVICSSFEILCGLTLTDQEFIKYKSILVAEILERLKKCAYDEGSLMLKEHKKEGKPLTEISEDISKRINYFTDQLLDYLETIELPSNPKDPLVACFLHYCPRILREKFETQLLTKVPDNHKKAIIASHIAARLVYQRGMRWFPTLIDILPLILHDKKLIHSI